MALPVFDTARFWGHVESGEASECWLWTAFCTPNGYGQFSINNYPHKAHRVAYELEVGPIPEGLTIDHVRARGCASRACVNPAHLEAVTSRENTMRGDGPSALNVRKTHCTHGHELTPDNVYTHPQSGGRRCMTCRADQRRHRREANRVTA